MFWLSLSTSQCPAYTYVQARTQLYIKGFTLFLPYRDKEVNYTVLIKNPHEHRLWVSIWKQARAKSVCATNDWTLAYLRKFGEGPSYSPLHFVDVQTLRIGWCIKTKYNIYMYCPLNYPWIILSKWNSFHYCWIQGNGKFNLQIYTLLRLYSTSPYYNNAHNIVFETELHQSKDFDEGSDLDLVF